MQMEPPSSATADSTPINSGIVASTVDGTTNTTNVPVASAKLGQTQQQSAAGTADTSECTSISVSTSTTNAAMTPTTDATPATSGGTRTASPRTASSEDANIMCGLVRLTNIRGAAENGDSAQQEMGVDLQGEADSRGVSDSKSMSSGGVAENTASAANLSCKAPLVVSGEPHLDDQSACVHGAGTDGVQLDSSREKGGESKEIKTEEGSDGKESKESKSNPFMHVEEGRGSALSSDNVLVC
jgi:hypothetical protein